jgi:hypothetical protein
VRDVPTQFAVDDLRIEAPACIVPPQQPDAPRDTEPATLSDYLQAWGGLVSAASPSLLGVKLCIIIGLLKGSLCD